MILMGTLPETTVTDPLLDAGRRASANLRRTTRRLAVIREVLPLTAGEVWLRFYNRGATDPAYVEPDDVDAYLRILAGIPGDRGTAARAAFLRGWAEHRGSGQ